MTNIPEKPTRREALELGLSQYNGRPCRLHPELEGRRRTEKCICVRCHNIKRTRQIRARRQAAKAAQEGRCHV